MDNVHCVPEAVNTLRQSGLAVCRIHHGEKRPTYPGWTTRSLETSDFDPTSNVGIICGWQSDLNRPGYSLVCVDLDSPEANELADQFLPPTGMVEGRESKKRSHRYYLVENVTIPDGLVSNNNASAMAAMQAGKHPGPATKRFKDTNTKRTHLDLIGSGGQVVCPPSVHPSGERRVWEENGHSSPFQPATLPHPLLWDAVCKLADALCCKIPAPDTPESDTDSVTESPTVVDTSSHPNWESQPGREKRYSHYLRSIPDDDLPRSGKGGHDRTFRLLALGANDFALPTDTVKRIFQTEINARLHRLNDGWTDGELDHKLSGAFDPDTPTFGSKANPPEDDRPNTGRTDADRSPPMIWNNPARLAEGFLKEHTVRCLRDTTLYYDRDRYRIISETELSAYVRTHSEREADRAFRDHERDWEINVRELESLVETKEGKERAAVVKELTKLRTKQRKAVSSVTGHDVNNTIGAIRSRTMLTSDTELNSWFPQSGRPPVLRVANGLLNPVSGELLPHSPDWVSLITLPGRFDPTAGSAPPRFLSFLFDVFGNIAELLDIVQEMLGACLDSTGIYKAFFALVGEGNNGKSVLLHVLKQLLGERNCSSVELGELSTNRFAAFPLLGKLANITGDQGYLELRDEGKLKTLTGGDQMCFEQKGKDPIFAVNTARIFFACNTLPTFNDKSEATWNRLIPIPFTTIIPAEKRNPELLTSGYWESELSAILNWALIGLNRLRQNRCQFTHSRLCDELKAGHRLDSNPARRFLLERIEVSDTDKIGSKDLYQNYRTWCDTYGYRHPLTNANFAKELYRAYPNVTKPRLRTIGVPEYYFSGIRYITPNASSPDE